jgi:hypothetical protein
MSVQKIDRYFAEDPLSTARLTGELSTDRDVRAVEEMFEQFLTPNGEEYRSTHVARDRVKSPTCYCPLDTSHPEPIAEELLNITIDLALATLAAAETALFAKFALLDNPSWQKE